ncbi:hypothetical protein HDU96_003158, partial [Phlyctochytrium bullatum]
MRRRSVLHTPTRRHRVLGPPARQLMPHALSAAPPLTAAPATSAERRRRSRRSHRSGHSAPPATAADPGGSPSPSDSSSSDSELPSDSFPSTSSSRRRSRRRRGHRSRRRSPTPSAAPPAPRGPSTPAPPPAAGPDRGVFSSSARQVAAEIAKVTWDGQHGRSAYIWIARLRLNLESRLWSPKNPQLIEQSHPTWAEFESSCRLTLFRDFNDASFLSELRRFSWDFPTSASDAWYDLKRQNNFLPPRLRLTDVALRTTWGEGCRDKQWKLILDDLRFPAVAPNATYDHPDVNIDLIIAALDARPYVPASTASSSSASTAVTAEILARVAAVERQVGRQPPRSNRLNLVAFSHQVEDSLGRPLQRPPPTSSGKLKQAYVNNVLLAAQTFAAKHPELDLDTNFDTYELSRLLDAPPPPDYDEGPLQVLVVDGGPQYRSGFPPPPPNRWPPRDRNRSFSRDGDRDRPFDRNRSRDNQGFNRERRTSQGPPALSSSAHASGSTQTPSASVPHSSSGRSSLSLSLANLSDHSQVSRSTVPYPPLLLFSILRSFHSDATHFGAVLFNKASSPYTFSHIPLLESFHFQSFLDGTLSYPQRLSLSRAICFADSSDLAPVLDAVTRFQYQCILVTAPAHGLPVASLDRLQALSAAAPVAVLSAPPRWSQLASFTDGSLAWLVDGTLATSTVDWQIVDPTHPPASVIPCGTLALGPYRGLTLFTSRPSALVRSTTIAHVYAAT